MEGNEKCRTGETSLEYPSSSLVVEANDELFNTNIGPPSTSGHRHNISATSIETVFTDSAIGDS